MSTKKEQSESKSESKAVSKEMLTNTPLTAPVIMLDVDQLHVVKDPKHPLFDKRALLPADVALAASIETEGLKVPLIVREAEVSGRKRYEVVAGRRRTAALALVNEHRKTGGKPPLQAMCVIESADEAQDAMAITILENELRSGDTVMARAEKAHRILAEGATKPRVARLFGVTTATINNWEKLINATDKVRAAVDAGTIAPTAAFKLAVLPAKEQNEALSELLEGATPEETKSDDKAKSAKVKGSSRAAAETASKRNERAQETRKPSSRDVGVLRDELFQTLKQLSDKDDLRPSVETAIEVLDWVLTGEEGEFVDMARCGTLTKITKSR